MPTSTKAETQDVEGYRLLLELWRREKSLARIEFVGLLIVMAILALVGLSGTWWPPLLGMGLSIVWVASAASSLGQQDHLYGELEVVSQQNENDPVFRLHRLVQTGGMMPVAGKAAPWLLLANRYMFVGIPSVLVVAWFVGWIVALAT